MYNKKLAIAIKCNNKVLRERGEEVYLPFGSEYSVFIKNLDSRRVQVNVQIDGTDVGDGRSFIINGNSSLTLTRFIKDGNLDCGNRFKFIERTEAIENHRGVGVEDGLVRVEYQFEREQTNYTVYPCSDPPIWNKPWRYINDVTCDETQFYSTEVRTSANVLGDQPRSTSSTVVNHSVNTVNDEGITVPGSISNQQFHETSNIVTDGETHVMILKLRGENAQKTRVKKPLTVRSKPKCQTCGRVNRSNAKFCTECGTSLTIV